MEIDFVFKIAAIGVLVAVLTQVLNRAGREDIATLVALSGLVVVLVMVVDMISDFFETVRAMLQF
ncbi:MAG: stage III sporulation protein AC [Eubacteriales bacterium]|nr:stage III sporulation protein AC [Eubacteriales bacterium]